MLAPGVGSGVPGLDFISEVGVHISAYLQINFMLTYFAYLCIFLEYFCIFFLKVDIRGDNAYFCINYWRTSAYFCIFLIAYFCIHFWIA